MIHRLLIIKPEMKVNRNCPKLCVSHDSVDGIVKWSKEAVVSVSICNDDEYKEEDKTRTATGVTLIYQKGRCKRQEHERGHVSIFFSYYVTGLLLAIMLFPEYCQVCV